MSQNNVYLEKYLKYKSKYLQLKTNLEGGAVPGIMYPPLRKPDLSITTYDADTTGIDYYKRYRRFKCEESGCKCVEYKPVKGQDVYVAYEANRLECGRVGCGHTFQKHTMEDICTFDAAKINQRAMFMSTFKTVCNNGVPVTPPAPATPPVEPQFVRPPRPAQALVDAAMNRK